MWHLGSQAFLRVMEDDIQFKTVLDVGCGHGQHTKLFRDAGYEVTPIDHQALFDGVVVMKYGMTPDDYYKKDGFDLVWTSHVLEHQMNTLTFLQCLKTDLKEGGWLVTTVPPLKSLGDTSHSGMLDCYSTILSWQDLIARKQRSRNTITTFLSSYKKDQ